MPLLAAAAAVAVAAALTPTMSFQSVCCSRSSGTGLASAFAPPSPLAGPRLLPLSSCRRLSSDRRGSLVSSSPSTSKLFRLGASSSSLPDDGGGHDDERRRESDGDAIEKKAGDDLKQGGGRRYRSVGVLRRILRRKVKPMTLAALTSAALLSPLRTTTARNPTGLLRPESASAASAPIPLREKTRPEDPPLVAALKVAKKRKNQRDLEEYDAFRAKCNELEKTQGKAAREEFEKTYQAERDAAKALRPYQRETLMRDLLDEGMCPFTDVEGQRQLFLFDWGLDLAKQSGTPQNIDYIKSYRNKGKPSNQYDDARYINKARVSDMKARGVDPLPYFEDETNMEQTAAIYAMDARQIKRVAAQYRSLMEKYNGRLTPPKEGEVPFQRPPPPGQEPEVIDAKAAAKAAKVAARQKKADERAAAKQKAAQVKAEKAKVRALEKAKRATEREEAKAANLAAKEAAKAEKAAKKKGVAGAGAVAAGAAAAAAAAAASGSVSTEVAFSSAAAPSSPSAGRSTTTAAADSEEAATAGLDFAATAGQEASRSPSSSSSSVPAKKEIRDGAGSVATNTKKKLPIVPAAAVLGLGGGAVGYRYMQQKSAADEQERQRQFKLIMGTADEDDEDDEEDDDELDLPGLSGGGGGAKPKSSPSSTSSRKKSSSSAPIDQPPPPPKKPRRKLGIFPKQNANARETDLNVLFAPNAAAPDFAALLAKILTYGAPGRFPSVEALPGGMPLDGEFDLERAKALLLESRTSAGLTDETSAETFACVVNCMIIDIIDLASSTLKSKEKKDKATVDALSVVMDFMDHAASLFDAVAEGVKITPVTYGGTLGKKQLEQMFSIYAASSMTSLDGGVTQDRVDTLQQVFAITDKKAEGLIQKTMMKNLMKMMKDGGEGMEGMEGMGEMLAAMGGAGGMPGLGGDMELSPEELKESVKQMKELIDSGSVSEEELAVIRKQFTDMYGSDLTDLVKAAEEGGEELSAEEKEMLDLFKKLLGKD